MTSLRPSEFNQRSRADQSRYGDPWLEIDPTETGVDVFFCVDALDSSDIKKYVMSAQSRTRILNIQPERLTIWPINIRPDKPDYLLPKYGRLKSLVVMRQTKSAYDLPENEDDVVSILATLPDGFSKQFQFGLGLHWENRFICETISKIEGVSTLCIHGQSGKDDARIDFPFFILGLGRFHNIRKELSRIASRHQRSARADKEILTYQKLLHVANASTYPQRKRMIYPDAISELTEVGGAQSKLSRRDRSALVQLMNENAEEIARSEPDALLSLKTDIERITLKELIQKFEVKLEKNLSESQWQSFFSTNPFVLSLAFSVPAVLIQDNPYIGGKKFDRHGGKISDFLFATASTGNLALIEIKKPTTDLLSKSTYRDGVHAMSPELNGTLIQVLDQRFKLYKSLPLLKDEAGMPHIHAFSVPCIMIAGITPKDIQEKKSLELVRNAFSGIILITYDELLGRLREIYNVLVPTTPENAKKSASVSVL